MTHVLCIGGTGMLTETTSWLDESFECVSVIGRDKFKVRGLVENHMSEFSFYEVDYRNIEKLTGTLEQILTRAPIDYVIAWIHSGTAPEALPTVLNEVEQNQHSSFRLFHVKGSAHAIKKDTVLVPANCLYREVILGFQYDGTNSRWLTHSEISKGVIAAIQVDAESTTIGVLSPWEKRSS
ncbi:short-chain dehydrogenase [Alkalicoccobacillus gibsonii]|uniref:Short-chain dehydrogenase n=1 Tax=Alkalicoccobacillus gibsonii TaxID=79881 RepID=A0ABU9VH61_9BACI